MATTLLISGEVLDPDVTISETYSYTAVATAYPVEAGANNVDHVQEQPQTISLALVISETPLTRPTFGRGAGLLQVNPGGFVVPTPLIERARLLIDRLRATWTAGETVTLQSARRGTVQNLAITSISEPYSAERAVQFSVSLVQIVIAASRTVAIPPTLQARGKKKRNRGKQPTAALTAGEKHSAAKKLRDSIFGKSKGVSF